MVAARLRRGAGGHGAALHRPALSRSLFGRRHQGGQLHFFRGGGAFRRAFERRRPAKWISGARPISRGRPGIVRRKPGPPGIQRGVSVAPGTGSFVGIGRTSAGSRNRSFEAGRRASQAGRQSSGERSLPQRTAVCHGVSRGLSLAGAGGQSAGSGAAAGEFARGFHTHSGAGRHPSPGGRRRGGLQFLRRPAVPGFHRGRDRPSVPRGQACRRPGPPDSAGPPALPVARPVPQPDAPGSGCAE